ncbi:MAG: FtsQ-type POTRA domain-containing protein [Clostridiaceae bacterium]|nr:FtsQ-type POTRA domain-containing protein [Clostridiaceae bacterium]MDY5889049.1 FtsQ-type POTRA domain-containing protein [Oscillospiraceae bacterium]
MKKLTARQIASMTPEARERYEKKLKIVTRNRRILFGTVAVVVVAAVFAVLSLTVLFNVSEVKVAKAGKHYQPEQIIEAADVDVGDNMVATNWDRVKEKVEQKLPYVLSLEIKKTVSGKITFSVVDDTATLVFKTSKGYALADANCKVLEIVKEKPKNKGLTLLTVKNRINADPGETISFADDGESILYDTIRTAIKNSGIGSITGIDISDPENIYLEYQSRYRLYLGNSEDIEYKLREAKKIIAEEDENDPNQIGEINLSILKKVYVEKLDTLEETTTAKKDVTTQPETTAPDSTDEPEEDETTTLPEEETEPDDEETTAEDIQEDE